ncbi:MAG: hypothetical protein AAF559_14580, partial [Pseudomonadota bacterium]
MLDPGEFDPTLYWLHVVLGFSTVVFVIGALASGKGSALHKRSGQLFSIGMSVAALTALVGFGRGVPPPPPMISALAALYGIGMAILSLKAQRGFWKALQFGLVLIPVAIGLLYVAFIGFVLANPDFPRYLIVLGPAAGMLFLVMAWKDVKFLRESNVGRDRRLKRHGWRMALVAAEVVRAPAVSFGPQFLGDATFDFYAFGSFLLVPLCYFLSLPTWLKARTTQPEAA